MLKHQIDLELRYLEQLTGFDGIFRGGYKGVEYYCRIFNEVECHIKTNVPSLRLDFHLYVLQITIVSKSDPALFRGVFAPWRKAHLVKSPLQNTRKVRWRCLLVPPVDNKHFNEIPFLIGTVIVNMYIAAKHSKEIGPGAISFLPAHRATIESKDLRL